MKSFYSFLIVLLCLFAAINLSAREIGSSKTQSNFKLNDPAGNLFFIENKGQVTDQDHNARPDIQFRLAAAGGLNVFIGSAAIHYQFSKADNSLPQEEQNFKTKHPGDKELEPTTYTMYRMDVELVGADKNAKVTTEEKQDYYENYYTPGTGENGAKALAYKKITYKEVYPHIDWVLYTRGGHLKHEFVVRKGGRVSDIQLKYGGATDLQISEDGGLVAKTPLGIITEEAPLTTQVDGKTVSSSFKLTGNILSYETAGYEGNLLIDPGLTWATYYGGSGFEGGNVAVDGAGYVYMGGTTTSLSGIATSGVYQTTYAGGSEDAFLVKFDGSGMRQWATYYGGTDDDYGYSVAADGSGNVYISGITASTSGIATPGAYQTTYGGGWGDAFLVKFDTAGVRQWATYYGGPDEEGAISYRSESSSSIAIDGLGNVYMSGSTLSTSGIASPGAYQTTFAGIGWPDDDAFLVKFDTSGVRQWATYYGGASREYGCSIATDPSANVYLAGTTQSASGIASAGAFQTASALGGNDAFLVKFDSSGIRQWATYYGGSGANEAWSVATDYSNNVYIAGYTNTTSGIATPGAYQTTYGGSGDAFLAKFDASGIRHWATYFGGPGNDGGYSIATDGLGKLYLAGSTDSTSGIATPGTYQTTFGGGSDAFLANFSDAPIMGVLRVCQGATTSLSCAIPGGTWSSSNTVIATVGSASGVVRGLAVGTSIISYTLPGSIVQTAMVTVVARPSAGTITGASSVCIGAAITLSDLAPGGVWSSTSSATITGAGIVTGVAAGTATISYTVNNGYCTATATKTITVMPLPNAGAITGASSVCMGAAITLSDLVAGGIWSSTSSVAITGAGILTGVAVGNATISYMVTNGCGTAIATKTITVMPLPNAGAITGASSVCMGATITLSDPMPGGTWSCSNASAAVGTSGIVTGMSPGTDTVIYSVSNMCGVAVAAASITIVPLAGVITGNAGQVCVGATLTLTNNVTNGSWSGSSAVASVSGGIVTGLSAGVAVISYTVANDCGTSSALFSVTVNPLPDAGTITGTDSVCPGDTVVFINVRTGGNWTNANPSVAGLYPATDGSTRAVGVVPGADTATYTVTSRGCSNATIFPFRVRSQAACDEVTDTVKGIGCSGDGEINVYPNPSREGQFTVYLFSSHNEEAQLVITNALGQKIYKATTVTNAPVSIDLNVAAGYYTVLAETPHGRCIEKVIVMRAQ